MKWNENFDDNFDVQIEEEDDWENICECGRPGVASCDCCGAPLCYVCAECGANFCNTCLNDPHTSEKMERLYSEDLDPGLIWVKGVSFFRFPDKQNIG